MLTSDACSPPWPSRPIGSEALHPMEGRTSATRIRRISTNRVGTGPSSGDWQLLNGGSPPCSFASVVVIVSAVATLKEAVWQLFDIARRHCGFCHKHRPLRSSRTYSGGPEPPGHGVAPYEPDGRPRHYRGVVAESTRPIPDSVTTAQPGMR